MPQNDHTHIFLSAASLVNHIYVQTHIHIYICAYEYIYTHIYIDKHTYICIYHILNCRLLMLLDISNVLLLIKKCEKIKYITYIHIPIYYIHTYMIVGGVVMAINRSTTKQSKLRQHIN